MSTDAQDHRTIRSLLSVWAFGGCSQEESQTVETHLRGCESCADEAAELRDAVALMPSSEDPPDLNPSLRARVLGTCLRDRAPTVALPDWVRPYDAETARLDALLHDIDDEEWGRQVSLKWHDGDEAAVRETSVTGVLGHLLAVDGMLSGTLGLPDPLNVEVIAEDAPDAEKPAGPEARTEAVWRKQDSLTDDRRKRARDLRRGEPDTVHRVWREQTYSLIRTSSFGGSGVGDIPVPYGDGLVLPLRLAFLDRAFETWIHATDIADAVDSPYPPPLPEHLSNLIGVAVSMLPTVLAARRQAGFASPTRSGPEGVQRSLHLRIEGESGGEWYLPLDDPTASASAEGVVARVVLAEVDFCRLAAGHIAPRAAAADQEGDGEAVLEMLQTVASMSRL